MNHQPNQAAGGRAESRRSGSSGDAFRGMPESRIGSNAALAENDHSLSADFLAGLERPCCTSRGGKFIRAY